MPESTEPAPENNKAKQTAYLVCDGALCQCDAGAAPVKLKVDSHKKAYINDNKLLATVKDIKFELPTAPFSTCKNIPSQNKTCQPKFEKWTKPYKDIEVEGNQVITDKSELLCMAYGGKVTITMHGQQQTVNAGQAENMDRAIAAQVNPLADLAPLAEADKKVAVKSIKGELVDDPKYKSVTSQKIEVSQSVNKDDLVKRKDDLVDIYVRPGQEVKFTADYVKGGTPELVCWKTNGVKGPIHFLQHGPIYKTSFPEVGKYTIEGYGTNGDNNLDIDTKIVEDEKKKTKGSEKRLDDRTCMLDIVVQVNKLNGIRHIESANVIKGKTEAHVRIGVPVTFEPVYLMPPIQEEIDHLILVIKDASGNEVQRSKGAPNIVFAAQNSAANYKVEAYFDNSEAAPFTYPFRTAHNTVSVIAASGMQTENQKIRPGKEITFSVKEVKFSEDTVEEELVALEHEKMKWYENSLAPVATGTTYTKTYHKEAEYVVKCAVTQAEKTWFSEEKNLTDDWRFEVTKNYPTAIEQKTEGKAKVGKKITFELKGIFEIDYSDAATITWQLTGPETITTTRSYAFIFTPRKNGTYKLTVTMNGQSKDHDFECITSEIVKGWWTDADGNILTGDDDDEEPRNTIGFAGWDQEVVAAFKHVGLNDEDVTLEVFQKNNVFADVSVFKKDVRFMGTGNGATCSVKLDASIKDEIKKNSVIGSTDALLYFTVKAKNGLKVINDGMALPDSDNYLNVDSKVRIKTYFADNNDTRRYSTAALDTPVYVQVKSTNLIGEELELEVWKGATLAYKAAVIGKRTAFKVDKYGMASIKLDMNAIKPELPKTNDLIYINVRFFIKNTGEELYLRGGNNYLTLYKTLATNASSIGTTKAFVVVDASEGSTGSCGGKYCIKTGDVSELVREINIRLTGFGGLVPTDQFTTETRKGVIQFQRDYMGIVPTGQVCGNTIKAIDEFSEKFTFKFDLIKCKCGKCNGFGNGKYSEQYQDLSILEPYRKFEYNGLHRSLLWSLKASMFYLNVKEKNLGYSFRSISSGYRCHEDNLIHGRSSTNHMGKALDILFNKSGVPTSSVSDMNSIREKIFEKYMGATYWTKKNTIGLESAGIGATSWIHFDVRQFDNKYLDKTLFVTSEDLMLGQKLSLIANKLITNCSGNDCLKCNTSNNLSETMRVNPKTIITSQRAISFIKDWEEFKEKAYNDSQEYCTIGYGHLIEKKKCKDIIIPEKFKNGITESQAFDLLKIKIINIENAVRRDIKVNLYQYEFDALVSLLYNAGENFLYLGKAPKLLKFLNNQKYIEAANEFLDITNSNTKGLVIRRNAEKDIFLNNIYNSKH